MPTTKTVTVSRNGAHKELEKYDKHIRHTLKSLGKVEVVMCMVATDSLSGASFNPDIRTQLRELRDLRESMEKEGFWPFSPIIVDLNGTIIDGHRRWTCAKQLNISLVPVIIVDKDPDELWAKINGTRLDLTGMQAMNAMAHGLKTVPAKYVNQIDDLKRAVGEEGIIELGLKKISPSIINQAKRIARYCDQKHNDIFIGIVVNWLANHRQMNVLSTRAMREGIDPSILERLIRGDRPIQANYSG